MCKKFSQSYRVVKILNYRFSNRPNVEGFKFEFIILSGLKFFELFKEYIPKYYRFFKDRFSI